MIQFLKSIWLCGFFGDHQWLALKSLQTGHVLGYLCERCNDLILKPPQGLDEAMACRVFGFRFVSAVERSQVLDELKSGEAK